MSMESHPAEPHQHYHSSPAPAHYIIGTFYVTRNDSNLQSDSPVEEEPSGQYVSHVLAPCVAIIGSACIIVILAFIISRMRRNSEAKQASDLEKEAYSNEGFTKSPNETGKEDPNTPGVFTVSEPIVFQPLPQKFKFKTERSLSERFISFFSKAKPLDDNSADEKVRNQLKSVYVY